MDFRTIVSIENYGFGLSHADRIFAAGSCFAGAIAGKLTGAKFRVAVNPLGVVYNPLSVAKCFEIIESGREFTAADLFEHNGLWQSFELHGNFSSPDKDTVLRHANEAVEHASKQLHEASVIIITLGTAWVYRCLPDRQVVCNCHKVGAENFERSLIDVSQAESALAAVIEKHSDKRIILTLSPVRHMKDGIADNSLSKAILRVAIDKLIKRFANAVYFPSFEIITDELRDYRFYARDMVHPSDVAVDYVWERFSASFFSAETAALVKSIAKIRAAAEHRPFNPCTPQHAEFKRLQLNEIEKLGRRGIDFSEEIKYFSGNE